MTDVSTRSIRHWKPLLVRDVATASPVPTAFKVRVGQGVHLLVYGTSEYPLHVELKPAADGEQGWFASAVTLGRYSGGDEVPDDHRAWLDALRRTVATVERLPGWADFLGWAADKPGVSIPKLRPDERQTSGSSVLIRIHEPCNAACAFCSCIGVMPDYAVGHDQIAAELDRARGDGALGVTFTGGEPTLRRDLPEVLRLAVARGFTEVSLQTNAVRLGDAQRARGVVEAGLTSAFVSLHSHRADRHDAILQLPGAFEGATAGIGHLVDGGVLVRINHVIQRDNLADVPDFARFLAARYGDRVQVTWSIVSPIGWALEHLEVIPKLSEVVPVLREALDVCLAAGIVFDVPGLCGMPMCQLPAYVPWFAEFQDPNPPPLLETRTHFAACDGCAVRSRCSGYWKVYADAHGPDEFVALVDVPQGAGVPQPHRIVADP